jgi:hypothetical protein
MPSARPADSAPPATRPTIAEKTAALHERWKARFAAERFNVVVAAPFLIAGDGSPQQLARYRDATVSAAAKALSAQFFRTPPDEPVLILLFESAGPYKRLAKAWFGDDDVPHYGFYRHADRTMLMNVSTGLGTLVHELVHALIAPDFPGVPDWFNEGTGQPLRAVAVRPGRHRHQGPAQLAPARAARRRSGGHAAPAVRDDRGRRLPQRDRVGSTTPSPLLDALPAGRGIAAAILRRVPRRRTRPTRPG